MTPPQSARRSRRKEKSLNACPNFSRVLQGIDPQRPVFVRWQHRRNASASCTSCQWSRRCARLCVRSRRCRASSSPPAQTWASAPERPRRAVRASAFIGEPQSACAGHFEPVGGPRPTNAYCLAAPNPRTEAVRLHTTPDCGLVTPRFSRDLGDREPGVRLRVGRTRRGVQNVLIVGDSHRGSSPARCSAQEQQ